MSDDIIRRSRIWEVEGVVAAPQGERAVKRLIVSDEFPPHATMTACLSQGWGRVSRPAKVTKVTQREEVMVP